MEERVHAKDVMVSRNCKWPSAYIQQDNNRPERAGNRFSHRVYRKQLMLPTPGFQSSETFAEFLISRAVRK
jgi:hypothetical protein